MNSNDNFRLFIDAVQNGNPWRKIYEQMEMMEQAGFTHEEAFELIKQMIAAVVK